MTTVDKFRNGDEVEFYGAKMVVDKTCYSDEVDSGWLPVRGCGDDDDGFVHLIWPDSKQVKRVETFVKGGLYLASNGHVYRYADDGESAGPWVLTGTGMHYRLNHPRRPLVHLVPLVEQDQS